MTGGATAGDPAAQKAADTRGATPAVAVAETLADTLARRGLDWIVPDWPAPPGVRALVTTRSGGASSGAYATMNLSRSGGDDPMHVAENERLLRDVTGVKPIWISQVHGTTVIESESVPAASNDSGTARVGDAMVARTSRSVAAVRIADCLPVLFCDVDGTCVGAAHAGWRGLAAGVLEATIGAMRIAPDRLLAWLGPAIGPDAFEVGNDVRDAFIARDAGAARAFVPYPGRDGKWLADLFALARMRLTAAGVAAQFGGGLCTYSNPDRFFSYRRERSSGRMAALIWRDA